MKKLLLPTLVCLATLYAPAQNPAPNRMLKGKILFQSSGSKPAVGVRLGEPDANAVYSDANGVFVLRFNHKTSGAALQLDLGRDDKNGRKIELVNDREIRSAKLPADPGQLLEIIVCPAGQRDLAAQKYYRILRTSADRELAKTKADLDAQFAMQDKNYQKIADLSGRLHQMQQQLDSARIREQAFAIAGINLDQASDLVRQAVKKIEEEQDVEGALAILNNEKLEQAYEQASAHKRKAEAGIRQVIEGYELKINLLEPQFRYGEIAFYYEKIAGIYENEAYELAELARYYRLTARYLLEDGAYAKALELSLKNLSVLEKILPSDHPEVAESYAFISSANGRLGDYEKELAFCLKAVAIREKVLPAEHPDLAASYNNLGVAHFHLGHYPEARQYHLRALAIRETALPAEHPDLAASYFNLAGDYEKSGEYPKQLEATLKGVAICEKAFPAGHPSLARAYNFLGLSYHRMNDFAQALFFLEKARGDFEKTMPAEHPLLAQLYDNLGQAHMNLDNPAQALVFVSKAIAIREKVLPPNHPDLANSYNSASSIYFDLGDDQQSLAYALKAVAILERTLPPEHPDLARLYANLAVSYGKVHDRIHQLEYNLKALAIREKVLPAGHPDLAGSYHNIGSNYRDVGDYAQALHYSQKAIAIGEAMEPKHRFLNRYYASIGRTYLKNGQFAEARAALERSQGLKAEQGVFQGWAMYYALQGDKTKALENLQLAVEHGFRDLKWLAEDNSMDALREEADFKKIVAALEQRK